MNTLKIGSWRLALYPIPEIPDEPNDAIWHRRATSTSTTTLQWDNFLCGYDVDNDEVTLDLAALRQGRVGTVTNPDADDYLYARYTFGDPGGGITWQEIAYAHDANGNLTLDAAARVKLGGRAATLAALRPPLRQGLTGDGLYKYTYDAWNP